MKSYLWQWRKWLAVLTICLFGLTLAYVERYQVRLIAQTGLARLQKAPTEPFPANHKLAELSLTQQKIWRLAEREYAAKPVSFDTNVLKYSAGVKEPWCANFVSWIYKEAGLPLRNPYSGSWRIPGVFTLQEYFAQQHKY